MLYFHVCTHVWFHLISNVDIVRTGAWLLKPFGERVEENHIYYLVEPDSTVKTRTVYIGCNVCYQVFWKIEKLTLRGKFETLT